MWLCSRCVKGEGEIEKLQSKMVELRRKLDDTTAAMQELGRENQSLQVSEETPVELMGLKYRYVGRSQKFVSRIKSEPLIVSPAVPFQIKQSQSLTRKWAEDHEVQNCMACGKGFSLSVRKVRVN